MAATTERVTINGHERMKLFEQLDEAGSTDPIRLTGRINVQIAGTATSIVAVVERASEDPNGDRVNWAPAEADTFSGNLSAGIAPRIYVEPADGFWRVRVTTLTGGYVRVSIVGDDA